MMTECVSAEDPKLEPDLERFRTLLVHGWDRGGRPIEGIMRERDRFKKLNVPFRHQMKAIYEMQAEGVDFFGLYHAMGLGKTVTVAMYIAAISLKLKGRVPKTLIACPAGLVRHWKKVLLSWLRIPEDRFLFVEKGSDLTFAALNNVDIVVVSRELLSKAFGECYQKVERGDYVDTDAGRRWVTVWQPKDPERVPPHPLYCSGFRNETDEHGVERRVPVSREFNIFVADEAHDLRNASSQRTNAFKEMSTRCQRRIAATGTPLMNRTSDIASQCLAMGAPKEPIDFTKPQTWAGKHDYTTLNERTNKRFSKLVNRATKDDLALPDMIHTAVSYDVNVPLEDVERYNEIIDTARDLRCRWDRNPGAVTKDDVAKLMALLQEAQFITVCPTIAKYGAARLQQDPELIAAAAQTPSGAMVALLAELRALQRDGHMRIIISSMHTSILRVAAKYLEVAGEDTGKQFFYDGSLTHKKRDESVHDFLTCRVGLMFLSIEAGGQGVHMVPGCEAMVLFGSTPWANAKVEQVVDRIHRMGQTCPTTGSVQIRRLVSYGSPDAAISAVHGCKRRLQKMTVDKWAEDTAARDDVPNAKRRKQLVGPQDDDEDDEDDVRFQWRKTGRIVDLCHKLNDDGNFGEMPLNSTNATGEVTGVYTVVPGVITRGREGELPAEPTPVPVAVDPPAPVAPVPPLNPMDPQVLANLVGMPVGNFPLNIQQLLGMGEFPPDSSDDEDEGPVEAVEPQPADAQA